MRQVVGDIEANGLLNTVTKIWCGVFKDINTSEVFKFEPHQMKEMCAFLRGCSVVIGHNFIDYDIPAMKKVLGFEFDADVIIIDTFILSQMLSPDRKKHPRTAKKKGAHSLENFGNIFRRYKPEHEDWSKFSPEMLHRCSEDVEINFLTFNMLNNDAKLLIKGRGFNTKSIWCLPYKIESKFAKYLVKQKMKGFLLNKRRTQRYIDYLTRKINIIDREIIPQLPIQLIIQEQKESDGTYKYNKAPFKGDGNLNKYTVDWCVRVGIKDTGVISGPFSRVDFVDFDIGSTQLVKDYLLSQGWIPEEWNTKQDPVTKLFKKTSPKLSQNDNFLGVEGPVGKRVAERLVLRHRRSQLEGFIKNLRPDGRVTADVTGITPTCRLKHSKIVNIPGADAMFGKQMRSVFTVPKGYKLIGCDAASCQLRDLCHHMGDDDYTYAVIHGKSSEGTDPHSLTCQRTGIPHRTGAKRFNYGSLFGAQPPKLTAMMNAAFSEENLDIRVTVDDVKKFKAAFFKNLPKYSELLNRLEVLFKRSKYIIGADGRLIFPRSPHQVLAYQLQSDEAIGMKVAYIYLNNWIEERGLDAHIVCFMHDEFQIEVLESQAEEVAQLAEEAIRKSHEWLGFNVPFKGEASVGKHWGETH